MKKEDLRAYAKQKVQEQIKRKMQPAYKDAS